MAINLANALQAFNSAGIDINQDFHTLHSAQVEIVLSCAKQDGYKQPKNSNGSKARYYFAALQRLNNKGK